MTAAVYNNKMRTNGQVCFPSLCAVDLMQIASKFEELYKSLGIERYYGNKWLKVNGNMYIQRPEDSLANGKVGESMCIVERQESTTGQR